MQRSASDAGANLLEPAAAWNARYRAQAQRAGAVVPLAFALEREHGMIARHETFIAADADADSLRYAERMLKFLLWSRGGWRVSIAGPPAVTAHLQAAYRPGGERAFDAAFMEAIFERPLRLEACDADCVPATRQDAQPWGGNWDGCRIGFDLGASDYKVAAVRDGKVVHAAEYPWHPRVEADPAYHRERLHAGLCEAARHLPRVDAIGGSTAGLVVDNRVMISSLFRAVPAATFEREVKSLFTDVTAEWQVPLAVLNDGEVTALAGALALGVGGVLGIALGSSEAAGYVDASGRLTGWIDELAFAPIDYDVDAPMDEWSCDRGVGAQYLSQQCIPRLARAAGLEFPDDMPLPKLLESVQDSMSRGDPRARTVFTSIGDALGHAIAHYAEFYAFEHLLVLGRVTTGAGGAALVEAARALLGRDYPAIAPRVQVHLPEDERERRVGQAVTAASLPRLEI